MLRRARRSRDRCALLESLESRCLLSTITVTSNADTLADDGLVTLREAIRAANTNQSVDGSTAGSPDEVDVIEFANGIESIALTNGQIEVTESLTIRGPEALVTIDAQEQSRHFHVFGTAVDFGVENLRVVNGSVGEGVRGGAIYVENELGTEYGSLSLHNSTFDGNEAVHGGAVYLASEGLPERLRTYSVSIIDSTFTNNSASQLGGAVYILNISSATIEGSTFESNSTTEFSDAALYVALSDVVVRSSSFRNNETGGVLGHASDIMLQSSTVESNQGTGAYVRVDGSLDVFDSSFVGNEGPGARAVNATVRNSEFTGNSTGLLVSEFADVSNSTFTQNRFDGLYFKTPYETSNYGVVVSGSEFIDNGASGISADGIRGARERIEITDSVISGNRNSGIRTASVHELTVEGSTIVGNSASTGGGLNVAGGTIRNSVIAHNVAERGGGIGPNEVRLENSTVAWNHAIYEHGGLTSGSLHSSIVAHNFVNGEPADASGMIVAENSLISAYSGTDLATGGTLPDEFGNMVGSIDNPLDAGISQLGRIGNSVPLIALLPGSLAINSGANPQDLMHDIRGAAREQGETDIGAFEGTIGNLFEVPGVEIVEGSTTSEVDISVTFVGSSDSPIEVAYHTVPGLATSGTDYEHTEGTIVFSGSAGETQTISVPITGDLLAGYVGQFGVMFELQPDDRDWGQSLTTFRAEVTVVDDDVGPGLANGELLIRGTDGDDVVTARIVGEEVRVKFNGTTTRFPVTDVDRVRAILGAGDDSLDLSRIPFAAEVDGGDGNDTIEGSQSNDTIAGGEGGDLINGRLGDDSLTGEGGDDTMHGAGGDDSIEGGDGSDSLSGTSGDDTIRGGEDADTLVGGTGRDALTGGGGNDQLMGGSGFDWLNGEGGDDTLLGGADADQLDGGSGHDLIKAGSGNDFATGGPGNDRLYGGPDNDVIRGDGGSDIVRSGTGDDIAHGDDGNDRLFGDEGRDFLIGGHGRDTIRGGANDDLLVSSEITRTTKRPGPIRSEWASEERDYLQRVTNIRDGAERSDDRRNGSFFLRLPDESDSTVLEDTEAGEVLRGEEGQDYFIASKNEGFADRVFREPDELFDRL